MFIYAIFLDTISVGIYNNSQMVINMNFGIEDETLEFKKSTGELNEAVISICAMLNKHGKGTLYFGILPNGLVCGQRVTDSTLRDVSRKIYESITPQIVPTIERKVIDEKEIIEVTFKGNEQPYSAKGVYYIRSADEDRVLPTNELRQLFEYKNPSWDSELTEYTADDIDVDTLKRFYDKAVSCGRIKDADFDPTRLLNKTGLLKDGRLTNAGYFLFSNGEPVVLKMAVFATDEKLTFIDINRITGNIYKLIEEATDYIKKNIRWRAEFDGSRRIDIPEVPLKALREIICNSFVHARYDSYTEHEIDIHPSFIKIYNPGEFPAGYTPEDFVRENIQSLVRNPLIFKTLFLSDDIESYGSGFKRVYDECGRNNVETSYEFYQHGFAFLFKRENPNGDREKKEETKELSPTAETIIRLIETHPYVSAKKLSENVNDSERTVQRILADLKENGVLERIGGTRGYWKINK